MTDPREAPGVRAMAFSDKRLISGRPLHLLQV